MFGGGGATPGEREEVTEHSFPGIEGREPTHRFAIAVGGVPIGLIQT
jgi:hypothetical protein